jgi:hypothetical protein
MVSAAVTGTGDPPPTLDVVPDVAAPGQVVTVVGDGFPDGAVLDLVWVDDRVVATVRTDERGSFRESVLVLPRTPAGPGTVRVPARENRFDVVRTTLLVGRRPGLPLSPALRGVGVNVGS